MHGHVVLRVQHTSKNRHVPACPLTCIRPRFQIGTAALSALSAAKIATLDHDGAAERTFRLYHNKMQNRTDAFSTAGAVTGALVAAAAGSSIPAGAAMGVAFGVVAHVVTKAGEAK